MMAKCLTVMTSLLLLAQSGSFVPQKVGWVPELMMNQTASQRSETTSNSKSLSTRFHQLAFSSSFFSLNRQHQYQQLGYPTSTAIGLTVGSGCRHGHGRRMPLELWLECLCDQTQYGEDLVPWASETQRSILSDWWLQTFYLPIVDKRE